MAVTTTPKPNPVTTPSSFTPKYAGWTKAQATEEAANNLMVQKFKEIVSSYETRKQVKSLQDLAKGPFYPLDYKSGLDKHNQGKRLQFLIDRHAFRYGFPPKGFDSVKDPNSKSKYPIPFYQIQKDVLPTQALENITDGQFSFLDCGQIAQLAIYETLREVYGDIGFNTIFSGSGSSPLQLHFHVLRTPLFKLGFVKELIIEDESQWRFGDHVCFKNIRVYINKHLYGEAGGFNTILISANNASEKKYGAFGLPVDGKTEQQMHSVLIEELNKKPIELSSILTGEILKYSQTELQEQINYYASMGIDLINLQVSPEEFDEARQTSIQNPRLDENNELIIVGRFPIIKRLDIQAIQKYLAN